MTSQHPRWLKLLRPPNLPTVPGDPLAGYALAAGVAAAWDLRLVAALVAALFIYMAGLVLNDVADFAADTRERPNRPLPSGAVSRGAAAAAGVLLGAAGVAAAALAGRDALLAAALLFALVLIYDFALPRGSAAGLLTMGLCRAASVVLGIAATGRLASAPPAAWIAAASVGAYIVGVSLIAARETEPQRLRWRRWLPLMIWAAGFGALAATGNPYRSTGLATGGVALFAVWDVGRRLGPQPPVAAVPPAIGGYIRCLLPVQAACCAYAYGRGWVAAAIVLLGLWPISKALARRFYAS